LAGPGEKMVVTDPSDTTRSPRRKLTWDKWGKKKRELLSRIGRKKA